MRLFPKLLVVGIILSYAICFGSQGINAQPESSVSVLIQQLQQNQTTDRAAEQLVKIGSADPTAKQYIAAHLPRMIEQGPKGRYPEDSYYPWYNAVRIAGQLRIVEAAPALVKQINARTRVGGVTSSKEANLRDSPAGLALVQIGDPAVPALQTLLEQGSPYERWTAAYALILIGSPTARSALREHAAREPDETLVDYIKRATSK